MQVKNLWIALLLCSSIFCYGQKPYNQQENYLKANSVWVFGHHAGLNFNSGSPVSFTDSIDVSEGCASVADPVTGQLLFYSDGKKCWNRNNQVMPNGDSLLGNRGSTSQGVCIVPMIDSPGKYYLFSLSGPSDRLLNHQTPANPGLYYSIVDMKLDNGLGDIVSAQKNIWLSNDTLSEAMIAIPGNNYDIWLLVHDYQKPVFKIYHITCNGLDTTPIVSNIGQQIQGLYAYFAGYLNVSPDRSMIALTSRFLYMAPPYTGILLAKFNATTGKVSDAIKLTDENNFAICFSPDNTKLYTTLATTNQNNGLIQWDVSNYDSASIVSSLQLISSVAPLATALKLYNGKIYTAYTNSSSMGIIKYPNLGGQACNFNLNIASLIPGNNTLTCFSNNVVFPLLPFVDTVPQILDTTFCGNQTLTLEGAPGYSGYYWDDGSTGQKRTVSTSGTYWVLNKYACYSRVDTFTVKTYDLIPPVIAVDSFTLSTAFPSYATYQWMLNGSLIPGATQSTYTIMQNGNYQVIVSNEHSCMDTSAPYIVTNYTGITDIHLLAKHIKVYPNPATNRIYIQSPVKVNIRITDLTGKIIKKQANATFVSINDLAKGIYLLDLTNEKGILLKVEKLVKTE